LSTVLYIQEPQSGGLKLKKNPKPTLYQRFLPPIVTGVCPRLPGFDLHGLVGSSSECECAWQVIFFVSLRAKSRKFSTENIAC